MFFIPPVHLTVKVYRYRNWQEPYTMIIKKRNFCADMYCDSVVFAILLLRIFVCSYHLCGLTNVFNDVVQVLLPHDSV